MDRKAKVKYEKKWKRAEKTNPYEKDIWIPEYGFKEVSCSGYQRYNNTLQILAGISKSARDVLDYSCERMDNNNNISSNQEFRTQFIDDIKKWTKDEVIYTDSSVKKAIYILVKKGVLLKKDTRGSLKVNPLYFFKGDVEQRLKAIKEILDVDPPKHLTKYKPK